jgi:YidC/Oxa1 family membrane protein insertase
MTQQTNQTDYEKFSKLEDPQDTYDLMERNIPPRSRPTTQQRVARLLGVAVVYLTILQIIPILPLILSAVFKGIAWILGPVVRILSPLGWILNPVLAFFDRGVAPLEPIDSSFWSGWSIEWLGVLFLHAIDSIGFVIENLPLPEALSAFSVTLIIIPILVKLVTYPIERMQKIALKAQAALQPQLQRLQQLHKGDREKLAQEQMMLYQKANVNPLSGCLPLLISLPLTFGVWSAIQEMILRGRSFDTHFMWWSSITDCDPNVLCNPGSSVFPYPVPIIVLAYTLLMWDTGNVNTQLSKKGEMRIMQGMRNLTKMIYSISLATMPAAIVLYLLIQSSLGLLFEWRDSKI